MEKSNKFFLIITIICAILVIGLCAFVIINHKEVKLTDAETFKQEYESYNKATYDNDKKVFKVSIDEDNPMVYKTGKEILDVIKKETAIIFFGFATDPNSRNVIETFLKVAKEEGIEKVYYVDIEDMRDEYEFDGTLIPKQIKKGSDSYYELLDFFGDKLERYYVPDENGNMYSTSVKRLEAATVITIDKKKIKDMHVGTVDNHFDVYKKLSKEEKETLTDIYKKLFETFQEE